MVCTFIPLAQIVRKRTPLINAVLRNDIAAVARILKDSNDADGFDVTRNTPLIFAARGRTGRDRKTVYRFTGADERRKQAYRLERIAVYEVEDSRIA